ncbi:MraY family glycosyltransferase [uncultured Amnibacterium sp.]|uniref:MraY family glycosyltransferase n=1 Tax=uncultured Amnibacterium sp. TaxID=1631851 RepID=UPI0035C97F75
MIVTLLVALCGAVVSFLMSIVMWRVGIRFKLHPEIRDRDVHTRPTPRLGGIAMYTGLLSALLVASQIQYFRIVFFDGNERQIIAILCAATLIVVMGVLDDFFDLDWTTKLIGQVLAAGLLAWLGGLQIDQLPIGGVTMWSTWSSLALTLIVIVVVMNMMNFIDGLDGLVAGIAIIANGAFFLYSYMALQATGSTAYFSLGTLISATMCGVCLGFLPLNWHPARLFMGDAGSLLVGLMFAVASIGVTSSMDPEMFQTPSGYSRAQFAPAFTLLLLPIAIMIVPLLDFGLAVVRRIGAGKSPFSADRKHLHHRLLDMGHSRLHATLIFYAWTAVISVGSLLFFVAEQVVAWSFIGGGLVVCAVATLAPLSHRKRREYRVQAAPVATTTREIAVLDPLDRAGAVPKERSA